MKGELSVEQKQELMTKSAHLRALMEQPGWPIFKEIFERTILAENDLNSLEISGFSLSKIGEEVRITRKTVRRLRIVLENVIRLVEAGDNLLRLAKLHKNPESLTKRFESDFGAEEDLLE